MWSMPPDRPACSVPSVDLRGNQTLPFKMPSGWFPRRRQREDVREVRRIVRRLAVRELVLLEADGYREEPDARRRVGLLARAP